MPLLKQIQLQIFCIAWCNGYAVKGIFVGRFLRPACALIYLIIGFALFSKPTETTVWLHESEELCPADAGPLANPLCPGGHFPGSIALAAGLDVILLTERQNQKEDFRIHVGQPAQEVHRQLDHPLGFDQYATDRLMQDLEVEIFFLSFLILHLLVFILIVVLINNLIQNDELDGYRLAEDSLQQALDGGFQPAVQPVTTIGVIGTKRKFIVIRETNSIDFTQVSK